MLALSRMTHSEDTRAPDSMREQAACSTLPLLRTFYVSKESESRKTGSGAEKIASISGPSMQGIVVSFLLCKNDSVRKRV
jgi:hypothetical protein